VQTTVAQLMTEIWNARNRAGKFAPVRQRLTLPAAPGERSGKALAQDKTLAFYGLQDGSVVQHKDLGPQVGKWVKGWGAGVSAWRSRWARGLVRERL